jgi:hypothetical protein
MKNGKRKVIKKKKVQIDTNVYIRINLLIGVLDVDLPLYHYHHHRTFVPIIPSLLGTRSRRMSFFSRKKNPPAPQPASSVTVAQTPSQALAQIKDAQAQQQQQQQQQQSPQGRDAFDPCAFSSSYFSYHTLLFILHSRLQGHQQCY